MNAIRSGLQRTMRPHAFAASKRGILDVAGRTIFRSNITYVGYVLVGSVLVEAVYGNFTDMLWRMNNSGKLYDQIDWSKFAFELDDEDEDEDDDDE